MGASRSGPPWPRAPTGTSSTTTSCRTPSGATAWPWWGRGRGRPRRSGSWRKTRRASATRPTASPTRSGCGCTTARSSATRSTRRTRTQSTCPGWSWGPTWSRVSCLAFFLLGFRRARGESRRNERARARGRALSFISLFARGRVVPATARPLGGERRSCAKRSPRSSARPRQPSRQKQPPVNHPQHAPPKK